MCCGLLSNMSAGKSESSHCVSLSVVPPFRSAEAPTYWKLSMLMTSMMGETTLVLSWEGRTQTTSVMHVCFSIAFCSFGVDLVYPANQRVKQDRCVRQFILYMLISGLHPLKTAYFVLVVVFFFFLFFFCNKRWKYTKETSVIQLLWQRLRFGIGTWTNGTDKPPNFGSSNAESGCLLTHKMNI